MKNGVEVKLSEFQLFSSFTLLSYRLHSRYTNMYIFLLCVISAAEFYGRASDMHSSIIVTRYDIDRNPSCITSITFSRCSSFPHYHCSKFIPEYQASYTLLSLRNKSQSSKMAASSDPFYVRY